MDGDGAGGGNGGVGRELVVYVLWGGELEENGDGKLTYVGGSTKCILLKEGMAMEEVLRLATGIRGSDLRDGKLWYSLKYDRQMLMAIEGDMDVRMILKGNDEHGGWVPQRGGCVANHPQSRLTIEEIIELSDDDEISVGLDGVGDEERNTKGSDEG
ncbi:hypothetical protein Cgig2_033757 [Carnegiea gigantea]|uniref:Uncharacterized protein n=1 Tax=Carnegiea gigantea TaxID=171969 RepID=A0A9Q1QK58_9CARY|nr:hypothetical protein Cgig2_033757 [Carnegiea gigantea]